MQILYWLVLHVVVIILFILIASATAFTILHLIKNFDKAVSLPSTTWKKIFYISKLVVQLAGLIICCSWLVGLMIAYVLKI